MNNQPNTDHDDHALLRGDGRYGFTARVEGDDLVVRGVRATWFGGAHDAQDNGQTASGVSTRLHPALLGCALPMNGFRLTRGSPLPDLPWMTTTVEIFRPANNRRVTVPLIDLGPAAPPHAHAAIDLTVAAFHALGGDPQVGSIRVDFRIPGAARRLPADLLAAVRASLREAPPTRPRTAIGNPVAATATATINPAPDPRFPAPAVLPPPAPVGAAAATVVARSAMEMENGGGNPAPGGAAAGRVGLAVPSSGWWRGVLAALGLCLVSTACAVVRHDNPAAWPEALTLTASAGHDEPGGWDRATVGVHLTWRLQPVRVVTAAATDASAPSYSF